jgi:predicted acylesterase/phospholipase RssA
VRGHRVVQYLGAFVVGLIPAAALAVFAWRAADTASIRAGVLILSLLPLALGVSVPVVVAVFLDLVRATSRNQFGLCTGRGPAVAADDPPPLTDWLETRLDGSHSPLGGSRAPERPAGYEPGDPLTFADLWGARTAEDARRLAADASGRRINLEVITTNLTQGRPYRLPFDSERLYFDPRELSALFSPRVIAFMERRSRTAIGREGRLDAIAARSGLVPLPSPGDLPVVVAVRMSLSFPILISAVPLWGFDFSYAAKDDRGERGEPRLSRCWFSDGGLTSNFPIHFFDGPIPRWPTFAFNLTPFHPRFAYDPHDERNNVWLPRTNGEGLTENWSNPPEGGRTSGAVLVPRPDRRHDAELARQHPAQGARLSRPDRADPPAGRGGRPQPHHAARSHRGVERARRLRGASPRGALLRRSSAGDGFDLGQPLLGPAAVDDGSPRAPRRADRARVRAEGGAKVVRADRGASAVVPLLGSGGVRA